MQHTVSWPRFAAAVTVFLFLTAGAAAQTTITTQYDVNVSNQQANITTLLDIDGGSATTWQLSWTMPTEGEILSIEDESGSMDYTVDGKRVEFTTNQDFNRNEEQVRIKMRSTAAVDTEYDPLKKLELSLSQLQTQDSTGEVRAEIHVDEPLISWRPGHNVNHEKVDASTIKFSSENPFNPKLFYSQGGDRTQHFAMFNTDYTPTAAEEFYSIIPVTTGFQPPYQRFPVVVLSDNRYESEVDQWSSGQYLGGGLIILKQSTINDPEDGPCNNEDSRAAATLLHEVTHGFNEHALAWDRTQSSWFDEGTGKYVEYVVNNLRSIRQAEIFGEEIEWEARHDGDRYKCTLAPRQRPEDLYNYYQNNQGFMPQWSPKQANVRSFGYAYSELFVRDIIRRRGFDALQDAYDQFLSQETRVESTDEKQRIVTNALDVDGFTPCRRTSLSQVESCTRDVNEMTVEFPAMNVTVKQITGGDVGDVDTGLKEITVREGAEGGSLHETVGNTSSFVDSTRQVGRGITGFFLEFFATIGSWILSLFS